jgi:hypothetical protein
MHPSFSQSTYLLKRQVLALTGKVRVFTPTEQLALYAEQRMFKLREDIRVYADEDKLTELIWIQARQIIDFAAAYDVYDQTTGMKVGTLRRKGWSSIMRDTWEVLDPLEQLMGVVREDSPGRAFLRRFLLGSLLPQRYEVINLAEQSIARYEQRFHLLRYELDIDFGLASGALDHRLGLAMAILLAIIEGKQQS